MGFEKPFLRVSFGVEETVKKIESMLRERHWRKFEAAELSLFLKPFFFVSFYAYSEKNEASSPIVDRTVKGKESFDPNSGELVEGLHEKMDESLLRDLAKTKPKYGFKILEHSLSSGNAKELAVLKISQKHSIPKEKIVVTEFREILFPRWVSYVTVQEGTYRLVFSALDGELLESDEVPFREKGWLEVTAELMQELKRPGAWVHYTTESFKLGSKAASKTSRPGIPSFFFSPYWLLVLILVVVLVVVALDFLGILKLF